MSKGRTTYVLKVDDPKKAEEKIQEYMKAYKFKLYEKKGNKCYRGGDAMLGYRFFNYWIDGKEVTLQGWTHGAAGDFDLDTVASVTVSRPFKDSLQKLIKSMDAKEVETKNVASKKSKTAEEAKSGKATSEKKSLSEFEASATKTDEKLCIAGFVISLVCLALAWFSGLYMWILYVLAYYFAWRGLKTPKKGLAIATFVITSITLALMIFSMIILASVGYDY